jgi:cardiolipin synthase
MSRVPCAGIQILVCCLITVSLGLAGCASWGGTATPRASPTAVPMQPMVQPPLGRGTTQVALVTEPDDGKLQLTRAIRTARRSIDLTMYMLTDRTVIHDLEYAAAKGVRVRVILERAPYGSDLSTASINRAAYDELTAAEIPVHWSSNRFTYTHEKAMIIDDTIAYILTMNFTRSAFTGNREFGVIDRDQADVRETEAVFMADWTGQSYVPHDPDLLLSPVNSRRRLLALLARAQRQVDVYAEEVQDQEIEAVLGACARHGVKVRVLTNSGAAPALGPLRQAGVAIHQVTSPYIHAKMMWVDGRWAYIGSENISATSLDHNRELGVLVANAVVLVRLHSIFAQDWSGSTS